MPKEPRQTDVTSSDYRALAEFRYQIRRYLAFSDKAAEAAGLRSRQYQLLLALKGLPEGMEATITNVAGRLGIRHHSAVELVNRLESRGLVKRERSDVHRSFVFVRITKEGDTMLRKLVASRKADLQIGAPILVKALATLTKQNAKQKKS
ncbi:MAG TPA: MarR family winged helix-turn-helix transcriptional regulator [Terriglobia bacterium]|jgi:DNA-binding MarR family transcriptional regulator